MMMMLSEVLDQYSLVRRIADRSRYQMDRTNRLYGEHLERPASTADLVPALVSGWIRWLEPRLAPATVSGHRGRLLILWRWAWRRGFAGPIDDVRPAPRPEPQPVSWTLDEVHQLLSACDQVRVTVRGLWMPQYLRALILAAYESGLRRGDLWGLRRAQIFADGSISIRQHKTGRVHIPRLSERTAQEVLALPGDPPLAWPGDPRKFYTVWDMLMRRAPAVRRGVLQQFRRTGATHIARDHGIEAARNWLGHRTPQMVDHYVDRRIAAPPLQMPPRVG